MDLAAALAGAGLPEGTPATIATIDRAGHIQTAVSGRWPNGQAVTAADRFYAASLAKQVTGAALALLVRDGRLDPDAGVATYLRALPAWGDVITARQLAHHVAGIPRDVIEAKVHGHWTDEAVMRALGELTDLTPGDHEVILQNDTGTTRHVVTVQAGMTASLVAPMGAAAAGGPVSGWVAVKAPFSLEIREQGRLLGGFWCCRQRPLSHRRRTGSQGQTAQQE